jgi:hypothetical protein
VSVRDDLVTTLEGAVIGETGGPHYEDALRQAGYWVDAIAQHSGLVSVYLREMGEPWSERHVVVEIPTDYSAADRFMVVDTRADGPHNRLIGEFGWRHYAEHVAEVLNASPYPNRDKDDEDEEPF